MVSYNVTKLTKRWIEALYGQGWAFISTNVGERFVLLIWRGKTALLWPWFCTLGNTEPLKKGRGHQDTRFYFRRQNLTSFFVSCIDYSTFHLIGSPLPKTDRHTLSADLIIAQFFLNSGKGETYCISLNDIKTFQQRFGKSSLSVASKHKQVTRKPWPNLATKRTVVRGLNLR